MCLLIFLRFIGGVVKLVMLGMLLFVILVKLLFYNLCRNLKLFLVKLGIWVNMVFFINWLGLDVWVCFLLGVIKCGWVFLM